MAAVPPRCCFPRRYGCTDPHSGRLVPPVPAAVYTRGIQVLAAQLHPDANSHGSSTDAPAHRDADRSTAEHGHRPQHDRTHGNHRAYYNLFAHIAADRHLYSHGRADGDGILQSHGDGYLHRQRDSDSDLDSDFDLHLHSDSASDRYAHLHQQPNFHTLTDAHTHSYANLNIHGYQDRYGNAYANRVTHGERNRNTAADEHCHRHRYGDRYRYPTPDQHADIYGFANSHGGQFGDRSDGL
jgi:hypothetical protein